MKTLVVHGFGDDHVCFRNTTSADTLVPSEEEFDYCAVMRNESAEYSVDIKKRKPAVFIVNQQIKITACFNNVGTWCFMPEMVDIYGTFPEWPIRVVKSCHSKRSLQLEIDISEDEINVTRIQ